LIRSLFDFAAGKDCAVPVSKGRFEPLVAVYNREAALQASAASLKHGRMSMLAMIARLRRPNYVPLADLQKMDPELLSFQNVNTPTDLRKARRILSRRR
jgi:molybdopterin-guanine dinucleotide biosynthesis protein A